MDLPGRYRGWRAPELNRLTDYAREMRPLEGSGVLLSDVCNGRRVDINHNMIIEVARPWSASRVTLRIDDEEVSAWRVVCGVVVGPGGVILRPACDYEQDPETNEWIAQRIYDSGSGLELIDITARNEEGEEEPDGGFNAVYVVARQDLSGYYIKSILDPEHDWPHLCVQIANITGGVWRPIHHGVVYLPAVGDADVSINGEEPSEYKRSRSRSISESTSHWQGVRCITLDGFEAGGDYRLPWRRAIDASVDEDDLQLARTECENTAIIVRDGDGDKPKLRYYQAWPLFVHGDTDNTIDCTSYSIERIRLAARDGSGEEWQCLSVKGWWTEGAEIPASSEESIEDYDVAWWDGDKIRWLSLSSLLDRWAWVFGGTETDSPYQPMFFEGGYKVPTSSVDGEGAWADLGDETFDDPYWQRLRDKLTEITDLLNLLKGQWRELEPYLQITDKLLATESRLQRLNNRISNLRLRVDALKLQNGLT